MVSIKLKSEDAIIATTRAFVVVWYHHMRNAKKRKTTRRTSLTSFALDTGAADVFDRTVILRACFSCMFVPSESNQ